MEKVEVKVILQDEAVLPKYMTEGAAGMDVYANIVDEIELKPLERVMVPTGLKVEIPFGYEIQVRPRSGLAIKHGLTMINTPGTIDSDYRGEIKIILVNISNEAYNIKPKERIGQLVLQKVYKCEWKKVDILSETKRDHGGFGHTGK